MDSRHCATTCAAFKPSRTEPSKVASSADLPASRCHRSAGYQTAWDSSKRSPWVGGRAACCAVRFAEQSAVGGITHEICTNRVRAALQTGRRRDQTPKSAAPPIPEREQQWLGRAPPSQASKNHGLSRTAPIQWGFMGDQSGRRRERSRSPRRIRNEGRNTSLPSSHFRALLSGRAALPRSAWACQVL